jgi:hypothetical protein
VVRALLASSASAVGVSAIVGVLLGAYLHELNMKSVQVPPMPTAPATVSTQVSTLVVTVTPATSTPAPTTTPQQQTTQPRRTTSQHSPPPPAQPTHTTTQPPAQPPTLPQLPVPTTSCGWIWCP